MAHAVAACVYFVHRALWAWARDDAHECTCQLDYYININRDDDEDDNDALALATDEAQHNVDFSRTSCEYVKKKEATPTEQMTNDMGARAQRSKRGTESFAREMSRVRCLSTHH